MRGVEGGGISPDCQLARFPACQQNPGKGIISNRLSGTAGNHSVIRGGKRGYRASGFFFSIRNYVLVK